MDKQKAKILLWISIPAIVIISMIMFFSISDFLIPETSPGGHHTPWRNNRCPNTVPIYVFWIFIVLAVIAILPLSYYFVSKKLDDKMETSMSVIMKLIDGKNDKQSESDNKESDDKDGKEGEQVKLDTDAEKDEIEKSSKNIILKILNHNERKILEFLIEKNGKAMQSELSKNGGMTKLNVHRAVKTLEQKGVVVIESHGMTNRIILSDDLKELVI